MIDFGIYFDNFSEFCFRPIREFPICMVYTILYSMSRNRRLAGAEHERIVSALPLEERKRLGPGTPHTVKIATLFSNECRCPN